MINRRQLLTSGGAALALSLMPTVQAQTRGSVIVVGGGMAGATAAKYLRMWAPRLDVTLVERSATYMSCIFSSLVLSGQRKLGDLQFNYRQLARRYGVRVVQGEVGELDPIARRLRLADGRQLSADRIVLAPGIEFDEVPGLVDPNRMPHAWKAGPQTTLLRNQLVAMPAGGTVILTIPKVPYRCPPGPYERACQVASYFKQAKPKSKVLILDANQDVTSKGALFKKVWAEQYKGIVEYRGQHKTTGVDAAAGLIRFDVQSDVKADVLNVLPPMRAGAIAVKTGLANANARWCGVNYQTFESTAAKDIHVIGDAIQLAPLMPKSGHMANSQAKVAAAAVVAELLGLEIIAKPMLTNTCYSFVDDKNVIHVASVHEYVAAEKTFKTVAGSGGVSPGPTELEGTYAQNWAQNIWADTLG